MADMSDTLERLLEDPEVLSAAEQQDGEPNALPVSGSPLGALPPDLLAKLPALMGALGPILGTGSGHKDERTTLLLALKPYMSPQRCDAIDKLITVCRLGEVFRQIR